MLDLVDRRRGAVMSAGTFITLMFNAVGAITIVPWAGRSLLGLALAAFVTVLLGALLWWWHLGAGPRADARAARISAAEPR